MLNNVGSCYRLMYLIKEPPTLDFKSTLALGINSPTPVPDGGEG
jgi:hypothetical protein